MSNTNPRVSVLLPLYGGAAHLRQTLDSLLAQTFTDFEIVAVNDASPDRSRDIVLSYSDPRIHLIENTRNLGQTGSLQVAFENARGEYLARQDQDDVSLPERFAKQVQFLDQNPEVAVLGTSYCVIDDQDRVVEGTSAFYPPETIAEMAWRLLWTDRLVDSSVMFRRAAARQSGGYNLDYRYAQDYDLWARLSFEVGVARLSEVLLQLRIHRANASNRFADAQNQEVRSIFRNSLNRVLAVPLSAKAAERAWRVEHQVDGCSAADVFFTARLIKDVYEAFQSRRGLRGRQLRSVRKAVAEKIIKIALGNASELGLKTLSLLFLAWSCYPILAFQPTTLMNWWRQRRQAQRFRQLVTESWIE